MAVRILTVRSLEPEADHDYDQISLVDMAEYAPPAPGTPYDLWTDPQQFEYAWIQQTVLDDTQNNPEFRDLDDEAKDRIWRQYVDWYFWNNFPIPGHEDAYEQP